MGGSRAVTLTRLLFGSMAPVDMEASDAGLTALKSQPSSRAVC